MALWIVPAAAEGKLLVRSIVFDDGCPVPHECDTTALELYDQRKSAKLFAWALRGLQFHFGHDLSAPFRSCPHRSKQASGNPQCFQCGKIPSWTNFPRSSMARPAAATGLLPIS